MRRFFGVWLVLAIALFAAAPVLIARAPFESTMGLVQKIFYFHAPSAMIMLISAFVAGVASVIFLFRRSEPADRVALAAVELTVLFGAMALVTGPIWARKAWGVWWDWDPRLTSSLLLWMMAVAILLVRKYGGPGSERLAAGVAIFAMANVPFVYISVNVWRTLHPKTTVVPSLAPGMRGVFWFCALAFALLYGLLLAVRVRLAAQQAEVERLFLDVDDGSVPD